MLVLSYKTFITTRICSADVKWESFLVKCFRNTKCGCAVVEASNSQDKGLRYIPQVVVYQYEGACRCCHVIQTVNCRIQLCSQTDNDYLVLNSYNV